MECILRVAYESSTIGDLYVSQDCVFVLVALFVSFFKTFRKVPYRFSDFSMSGVCFFFLKKRKTVKLLGWQVW